MIAWLRARSQGGKVIMRMEDLDHPKDKPGAAAQAIEDLKWLGFDWDEEYVQSERKPLYAAATKALHEVGLIYPCVCSRRDVEAAQSAPHAGEQLYYPGTCRGRFSTWSEATAVKPSPCWRFNIEKINHHCPPPPLFSTFSFTDAFAGHYTQDIAATLGDFPLARDEGGAGYTLAAVYDDLAMGVTEVVRGDDLLAATPAQLMVAEALIRHVPELSDCRLPSYLHVPLVVGADGKRLAKRHGDTRVATYREQGIAPERILGRLAASCGWCASDESLSLRELLPRFDLTTIPPTPYVKNF